MTKDSPCAAGPSSHTASLATSFKQFLCQWWGQQWWSSRWGRWWKWSCEEEPISSFDYQIDRVYYCNSCPLDEWSATNFDKEETLQKLALHHLVWAGGTSSFLWRKQSQQYSDEDNKVVAMVTMVMVPTANVASSHISFSLLSLNVDDKKSGRIVVGLVDTGKVPAPLAAPVLKPMKIMSAQSPT